VKTPKKTVETLVSIKVSLVLRLTNSKGNGEKVSGDLMISRWTSIPANKTQNRGNGIEKKNSA
jgi:hypothetical protein